MEPTATEENMSHSQQINREHPTCFLFLIDQSGSMEDPIGGGEGGATKHKSDVVADALNRFLQELSIKCAKDDGVRDYFDVGVIGYGSRVGPAFGGPLSGRDLVPISEVASTPARIEDRAKKIDDGAGGLVDQTVRFPVWFEPTANGGTPMCQALVSAQAILTKWLSVHNESYPPVVINFTDGEATDGDPSRPAEAIRSLTSVDGNILLFNCHISSRNLPAIKFPETDTALPDEHARLLFGMSSTLPPTMRDVAAQSGVRVTDGTRGFTFNADIEAVVQFLDIGTRTPAPR
jgi:hypothetical protein